VRRGDRVAVVLPDGPEMAAAFLAVASGAACAPLNPLYRVREFEFYLSDVGARALIVPTGTDSPATSAARSLGIQVVELTPSPDREAGLFMLSGGDAPPAGSDSLAAAEDVALVLHTSVTTALPKSV